MPQDQETFDLLESETRRLLIGNRTASTALLAWFLETVWRLDPEDVSDAICDGGGDKGIDAMSTDDDLMELTVFQAKHRSSSTVTQGDADLRAFVGVAGYFAGPEGIDSLLASGPNEELVKLIRRLGLRDKLSRGSYSVRLVFVTNAEMDVAGTDYVTSRADQLPVLDVWPRSRLAGVAERTRTLAIQDVTVTLSLASDFIYDTLDSETKIGVALVAAPELVRLPGVDDLSIFDLNVRLGLGKTKINKDLATTIIDPGEHSLFPAYHNGLTLLTREIEKFPGEVILHGVSVVNGCQSLLALYNNRSKVTPQLRVLVKIVELGQHIDLVNDITYRTNNQNPVNVRDQRSTDATQRDLQEQVRTSYGNSLAYSIRQGEHFDAPAVIDNTLAGQLITAVYLREPWNAVRKLRLFEQDYHRIFNREMNGDKVFLLHVMNQAVILNRSTLRDDLESSFASVRFTCMYLLATMLELFPLGEQLLKNPDRWLPTKLSDVEMGLNELADEVADSLNYYIDTQEETAREAGEIFDPKTVFKSKTGVQGVERAVIGQARYQSRRNPDYGFQVEPE